MSGLSFTLSPTVMSAARPPAGGDGREVGRIRGYHGAHGDAKREDGYGPPTHTRRPVLRRIRGPAGLVQPRAASRHSAHPVLRNAEEGRTLVEEEHPRVGRALVEGEEIAHKGAMVQCHRVCGRQSGSRSPERGGEQRGEAHPHRRSRRECLSPRAQPDGLLLATTCEQIGRGLRSAQSPPAPSRWVAVSTGLDLYRPGTGYPCVSQVHSRTGSADPRHA